MVLTRTDLDDIKKVVVKEFRAIFVSELKAEIINAISGEIEKSFQKRFSELEEQVDNAKSQIVSLHKENPILKRALDFNEQHSRNHNIRILGMAMKENEDILQLVLDFFNRQMNIPTINSSDIKKCHRVTAKHQSSDKPRVVLVEFNNVNKRFDVLKSRKCLKNKNISDLFLARVESFFRGSSYLQHIIISFGNGRKYIKRVV